jgi:oligoribonuclease
MSDQRLVFADLETLGLESTAQVVEVAMIICASNLDVIAKRSQVIHASSERWDACSPFVQQMHSSSGLMDESTRSAASASDVDHAFVGWLSEHGFLPGQAVLVGNSIGQDRHKWIATQMPALDAFLDYRTIDVSAVRMLIQRWAFPGYSGPKGDSVHRALPDCEWARNELALYRRAMFVGCEDDISSWLGAPLKAHA